MATPPHTPDKLNKVVVACLDGRRLKGYLFNFSPLKDTFSLLPEDEPLQHRGTEVAVKDLKAVFFVKDFIGNPDYHESQALDPSRHGRRIEVSFRDGEKITGTTEGYNPQKLGFFLFPADLHSNNIRIFVVNQNVTHVKLL